MNQLIQGEPKVFVVAFLREVEGKEKEGQDNKEDVNQVGQSLKQGAIGPQIQLVLKIVGISQVEGAAGEEAGICAIAEGDIEGADDEGERSLTGGDVEIENSGNLLILLSVAGVRTLGQNETPVSEDV